LTYREFRKEVDNPYETILGREVRNWLDHSKMIAVFHVNPINAEEFFKARVAFHKSGMTLKKYGSGILSKAVKDSKYEVLLGLNNNKGHSTAFAFCTEHQKTGMIMKIIKKMPQFNLLCGVVDDRLLSRNEFIEYSKMPNIDIVRSQFANVLNLAGSQIVQNLQSHQSNLVNILDAHVRVNEKPAEKPAEQKADDPEKS
jgi:large subunit ribosomal protein L10